MTPKEKRRVMDKVTMNTGRTSGQWAVIAERGRAFASARIGAHGHLYLELMPNVPLNDRHDRLAWKIAKRAAATFFKHPRFVSKRVTFWGERAAVFRFMESKVKR